MIDIIVPRLGESITEAIVARWLKKEGDTVLQDEPVVELETDKITIEVAAPKAGILEEIVAPLNSKQQIGALLGRIEEEDISPSENKKASVSDKKASIQKPSNKEEKKEVTFEKSFPLPDKEDKEISFEKEGETRIPMTTLRRRIAERLKESQNTAAMLTTFNEINMSHVIEARTRYQEAFEKKYGNKLGFMSFFVKASLLALREIPVINAYIDGSDIVYKNYYNIGVAVGTDHGLVVPVVKDADTLSFAQIEQTIATLAQKARENKLEMEDLSQGTFTITNGGVYGSLLSTPILNPPQSGILGLHKIEDRPIALEGNIVIRPMMYVALTYDHRLVDGKEAVAFLVRIKETLEDPERLFLEI